MQELFVSYGVIKDLINESCSYYSTVVTGYELYVINSGSCIAHCAIHDVVDITDFETNYKSLCSEVTSKDDALALGMYFHEPTISVCASGAIPNGTTEFTLGARSSINSLSGTVETVSAAIPNGAVLRLLMARATTEPITGQVASIFVQWRNVAGDHLVGMSYLNNYSPHCFVDFPATSQAIDGVQMVGDGVNGKLVIQRAVSGLTLEDTMVVVRGYYS